MKLRITNISTGKVYISEGIADCHTDAEREAAEDYLDGAERLTAKFGAPTAMFSAKHGIMVEKYAPLSPQQQKARDWMLSQTVLEIMGQIAPAHCN